VNVSIASTAGRPAAPAPVATALPGLAEVAARHTARSERDRRLAPEVISALVEAGVARHFTPARRGGADGSFADLTHQIASLGESCASAAWCGTVFANAARMGAYLPEAGQDELWAEGPDVLVAGALVPGGEVTRAGSGWRVSGEWPVTSGVDYADWALVCGAEPSGPRFFAIPRSDFGIRDTWHTMGMRGTGSNTLTLDAVLVPEHRAFPRADMLAGRAVSSTASCHTVPLQAISGLAFAAPPLGAARAGVAAFIADFSGRPEQARQRPAIQQALARASAEIDAAGLLLDRAAQVADSGAVSARLAARAARDSGYAAELLVSAVDRLFRGAGLRAQADGDLLQRAWRDVRSATGHVSLQLELSSPAFACAAFG
jgi:two-component flavin-dependent monooxygenase